MATQVWSNPGWVRWFDRPDDGTATWLVFDRDGEIVGVGSDEGGAMLNAARQSRSRKRLWSEGMTVGLYRVDPVAIGAGVAQLLRWRYCREIPAEWLKARSGR